jgi:hypothetical protein
VLNSTLDYTAYARAYPKAGVFWQALATVDHVRQFEQLTTGSDDYQRDPIHQARLMVDSTPRAHRDLALAELFAQFASGETTQAHWYEVLDSVWEEETRWMSSWLKNRLAI